MVSFVANTFLPVVSSTLPPFVAAALAGLCVRIVAVWCFRRTDAPIMKERINKGSDRFFKDRQEEERAYIAGGGLLAERHDSPITPIRVKRGPIESRR
jgi:hypothetical protein